MKVFAKFLFGIYVFQLYECYGSATDKKEARKKIKHDGSTIADQLKEYDSNAVSSDGIMNRRKTFNCDYIEVQSNDTCSYKLYARNLFCFTSSTQEVCHVNIGSGTRIRCSHNHNISRVATDKVEILSMKTFADALSKQSNNACTVVLFYATWCPFSMKLSPNYNALGRIFGDLDTFAVNVVWQTNSFMTRYGTVAVPAILIFEGAHILARYSASNGTLPMLIDFVSKNTNLSVPEQQAPDSGAQGESYSEYPGTEEEDFVGPVPTRLNESTNWGLWGCILFLALFSIQEIISHKLYLKILPAFNFLRR